MRRFHASFATVALALCATACSKEEPTGTKDAGKTTAAEHQSSDEGTPRSLASNAKQPEELEAMRAPDDMFFALAYLDEVNRIRDWSQFALSGGDTEVVEIASELEGLSQDRSGIFSPERDKKRLALAALVLLKQADKNRDKRLSQDEFLAYRGPSVLQAKLSPDDLRAARSALFSSVAGDKDSLGLKEIYQLLVNTWSAVEQARAGEAKNDRLAGILNGWRSYALSRYDKDHDGKLSFEEQRDLKKDRDQSLAQLKSEFVSE